MGRLKPVSREALEDAQREFISQLVDGKRGRNRTAESFYLADGSLREPFGAWLYAPAIGQPAQQLGEAIRFSSTLTPAQRELAILTVAAEWRADYEWWAHRPIAVEAGLPESVIDEILSGAVPRSLGPALETVHEFSRELLSRKRVSDEVYRKAADALGDQGTVELVALLGYYTLVSMTLNAFEVDMPGDEPPPFKTRR